MDLFILEYVLSPMGIEHTRKQLPFAIRVMQSSSYELSTPVAVKRIYKQKKYNTYV